MRTFFTIIILLALLILLTGCYDGRGYAYEHLQEQNVGSRHTAVEEEPTDLNLTSPGGVFENLNKNFCEINRYCCGDFTEQEIALKDFEQQAIVEENIEICWILPEEDLLIDCPNEELILYYSKTRCLAHFTNSTEEP